ncbi:MAG: TonB-dependent siderophore receptor [Sphingobium sp.]
MKSVSLLSMALATSAFLPHAALANDARRDDETREGATIVVTGLRTTAASASGTKTNTPLIETPQSVTVIDNEELVRRNALSISQALGYVAGVSPSQRGNIATRYDQLLVRGFSPALFLDGMRLQAGTYSTPQIDFHRLESVDVVKGPSSVLYGNSGPGGLVNLTSKTPLADPHGSLEVAAGNYNLWRGVVDVGTPLDPEGKVRVRLIGGGEKSDGFIDYTKNERYYVSPMVSFAPTDRTSFTLILAYQRDPKGGSYGSTPVYGSALPNINGTVPVDFYDGEPSYEAFDRKQWSLTVLARHQLSDAVGYRGNLRYMKVKQHYRSVYNSYVLSDQRTMIRGGGGSDEDFDAFSIDNSLTAQVNTGPLHHELLVGLDFLQGKGIGYQRFVTGAANGIPDLDIFNPVYYQPIPDVLAGAAPTRTNRDQIGLYAQDQIRIGGLNLLGSIRKDWYNQQTQSGTGTPTRVSQDKLTYRLGALYTTSFGLAPYFSYSTSFEPQSGVNAVTNQPYVPVTGRQYEAGLKFQPPGTDSILTLSVFDLARQNVVVTDPVTRNSVQVGEQKSRGIELEGRGSIGQGFDYVFSGSYLDARYSIGNPPSTSYGSGGDVASGVTGTKVLAAPEWTGSAFLSYDLTKNPAHRGAASGLSFGGGVRYVGPSDGIYYIVASVGAPTDLRRIRVKGYTLFDAMLGYDLGRLQPSLEGLSLTVNASNIFDKRHTSACIYDNWCYFGASRTVVASLRYKW